MMWTRKQVIQRMTQLYDHRLKAKNASEAKLKEFDDAIQATQHHCDHEWRPRRNPPAGSDSYDRCQVCGKWQ